MTEPIVEITRREEFSASHRLHDPRLSEEENQRLYGLCNNAHGHGHNYELEVCVRGPIPRSGMVMDLNRLMMLLREKVVVELDHKHLNHDVPFLREVVPTAENLAVALWDRLEPEVREFEGCRLHRIRLWESRNNSVEYRGPEASSREDVG